MAITTSSGTYTYDPALSDLVLEAYSRCGIRAGALNGQHMLDARMSSQLLMSQWSARVPNLWLVTLQNIPLYQGVSTYTLPSNTVTVLDTYVRTFQVGNAVNEPVAITTTSGSTTASIYWPAHNLYAGQWMEVTIPVAVGGVIVQGFYQAVSITDVNNFTITLTSAALSSVTGGGALPYFTTTTSSSTVTVTLANHGYAVGQYFPVQVTTTIAGLTLAGSYQVQSVTSTSVFTITATGLANASKSAYENAGLQSYASQLTNVQPNDRILNPISRTDYAAQPNKAIQATPTTYWLNRQVNPIITMWPTPDGNGPYVLGVYTVTQPQDAVLNGGVGVNVPYRFFDAFAAALARRLARKYAPMLVQELAMEEAQAWEEASAEDVENAPLFISPGMSGYFS